MTFFAHLSIGFLIYKIFYKYKKNYLNKKIILTAALLGTFAPDIDGLFGNQMNNHRYTLFHSPLFWLGIFILIYLISILFKKPKLKKVSLIFTSVVFSHLFLDWLSARTCGIRIFYPFSKRVYSFFPLQPVKGAVPVLPSKEQLEFWQFYFQNKILIVTEGLIIFLGLFVFILERFKSGGKIARRLKNVL